MSALVITTLARCSFFTLPVCAMIRVGIQGMIWLYKMGIFIHILHPLEGILIGLEPVADRLSQTIIIPENGQKCECEHLYPKC
jgi:hypothetical protein